MSAVNQSPLNGSKKLRYESLFTRNGHTVPKYSAVNSRPIHINQLFSLKPFLKNSAGMASHFSAQLGIQQALQPLCPIWGIRQVEKKTADSILYDLRRATNR